MSQISSFVLNIQLLRYALECIAVKKFENKFCSLARVLLKWLLDKWDPLEADLNITLVVMREGLWPFNLWDIFQWQHTLITYQILPPENTFQLVWFSIWISLPFKKYKVYCMLSGYTIENAPFFINVFPAVLAILYTIKM